jgi:predicted transcriptional regulator
MKRVVVPACAVALALLTLCAAEAQDRKKPAPKPAEITRFKKIMKKLDPEITAAQKALQASRKRLQAALKDEVLKEKGPVEGKVIDQLKLSLRGVDAAIRAANKAQRLTSDDD